MTRKQEMVRSGARAGQEAVEMAAWTPGSRSAPASPGAIQPTSSSCRATHVAAALSGSLAPARVYLPVGWHWTVAGTLTHVRACAVAAGCVPSLPPPREDAIPEFSNCLEQRPSPWPVPQPRAPRAASQSLNILKVSHIARLTGEGSTRTRGWGGVEGGHKRENERKRKGR